jgi:wyosine [tRNA(Phe)-imidazoG37] synthetase (radical SAM superfamily)
MFTFGPVPSRRLGSSLGINHIPPKHCPYACVYCQVGNTTKMEIQRHSFVDISQILAEVETKLNECARSEQRVDFITLVPDGEPSLELHLGNMIRALKRFDLPVAVISNAALIDRVEIQADLSAADWVSLKVDSVDEGVWRQINRPHGHLSLPTILEGMLDFRKLYLGELVTETMLVDGVNDSVPLISRLITFLSKLQPHKSYFSLPTRPPVESWVKPPPAAILEELLDIITRRINFSDILFEADAGVFHSTGRLAEDILNITAVHPLSDASLHRMIEMAGENWSVVEKLITDKKLIVIHYREELFYCSQFRQL